VSSGRSNPAAPARLALCRTTFVAEGRPRVRVTQLLPDALSAAEAIAMARARAHADPGRRYQLIAVDAGGAPAGLLWDSHPSC
jgi:hypothetical protein